MDRSKIIAELWESKEVNLAFAKMHPVELQYDLKAEVFLVICEMDEEKLLGMYQRNEIKFYIVRCMLNMIKSDRSAFWKLYRNHSEYVERDTTERVQNDIEAKMLKGFEEIYWYNKKIFELYTYEFDCNAKALSRETGINYMAIIRSLKQTKEQMKKIIRNNKD